MKEFMAKISKAAGFYCIFLLIQGSIFAFIYSLTYGLSYKDLLLCVLIDDIPFSLSGNIGVCCRIVQNLCNTIVLAVLTGYIFRCFCNIPPRIRFHEQLVIRHRTSDVHDQRLTVAIMIGNLSKQKIRDISCRISCSYIKENGEMVNDFALTASHSFIEHFYRFSFVLEQFPVKLLEDFISKESECLRRDRIWVEFSGIDGMGNSFAVSRTYHIDDLEVGEQKIQAYRTVRKRNGEEKQEVDWNSIFQREVVSEDKRKKLIGEIREIIEKKKS